uniref:Uncharacterized protein n=1 Tax=Arundo donax TaxID=35708 RepID=A0A0A9CUM6_ARUDO
MRGTPPPRREHPHRPVLTWLPASSSAPPPRASTPPRPPRPTPAGAMAR